MGTGAPAALVGTRYFEREMKKRWRLRHERADEIGMRMEGEGEVAAVVGNGMAEKLNIPVSCHWCAKACSSRVLVHSL